MIAIGFAVGLRPKGAAATGAGEYFLAGKSLRWPIDQYVPQPEGKLESILSAILLAKPYVFEY